MFSSQTPERKREYNRLYRERNATQLRAYDAARYERRLAERMARMRSDSAYRKRERDRNYEWRRNNPEQWRHHCKKWRDANPDYIAPFLATG